MEDRVKVDIVQGWNLHRKKSMRNKNHRQINHIVRSDNKFD